METLTDMQKKIGEALIDWALSHEGGEAADLLIDEQQLAKEIGEKSWRRSHVDDLDTLISYCDRKGFPLVSLLVVIPGFGKPEKTVMIHAFKATLPTAEADKRWKAELQAITKTKPAVWEEFKESLHIVD